MLKETDGLAVAPRKTQRRPKVAQDRGFVRLLGEGGLVEFDGLSIPSNLFQRIGQIHFRAIAVGDLGKGIGPYPHRRGIVLVAAHGHSGEYDHHCDRRDDDTAADDRETTHHDEHDDRREGQIHPVL